MLSELHSIPSCEEFSSESFNISLFCHPTPISSYTLEIFYVFFSALSIPCLSDRGLPHYLALLLHLVFKEEG
jgi:hypothetical protein